MLALHPRVVDVIWQAIEPRLPEVIDEHPLGWGLSRCTAIRPGSGAAWSRCPPGVVASPWQLTLARSGDAPNHAHLPSRADVADEP